jgi:Putative peptidoglycan binding domain
MKRLVTLVTVVLVGLASVQAAQSDDQQKKKKKKAQTTSQTTPAPKTSATQTSTKRASSQTSSRHVSSQTSSNQQVTTRSSKKAHPNVRTSTNSSTQTVNKSKKSKQQTNVVTNNNVQVNKKEFKHFKRTGNEVSFNVARSRIVRERHDRNWWHQHYSRIIFYGGGYWYWNAGWWYPAWGYSPYYNNYFYNGPIFGYGYASPFDVTAQVQRALAARGYYYGPIDGILGPGTRNAIQRYQIDHGLYATAAIDEPTLATLGLA